MAFKYGSTMASKNCVDVPLAADMVGGAEAELVVFRRGADEPPSRSSDRVWRPLVITFGRSTDQPVLGDWDGDGKANVGVRRPEESTFYLSTPGGTVTVLYGIPSDRPIAGDWNGDGATDVGVHRSSEGMFYLRNPDGSSQAIALGDKDDLPVTGDWNGDGVTDLGVYDSASATFQLRYVGASGVAWLAPVGFGVPGRPARGRATGTATAPPTWASGAPRRPPSSTAPRLDCRRPRPR